MGLFRTVDDLLEVNSWLEFRFYRLKATNRRTTQSPAPSKLTRCKLQNSSREPCLAGHGHSQSSYGLKWSSQSAWNSDWLSCVLFGDLTATRVKKDRPILRAMRSGGLFLFRNPAWCDPSLKRWLGYRWGFDFCCGVLGSSLQGFHSLHGLAFRNLLLSCSPNPSDRLGPSITS